jgi:hypothetical protein
MGYALVSALRSIHQAIRSELLDRPWRSGVVPSRKQPSRKPHRRRPNDHAKSLADPKYRPRVVPSGKRRAERDIVKEVLAEEADREVIQW